MDHRPEPQRIEIELTSHEPRIRRSDRADASLAPVVDGAESDPVRGVGSPVLPDAQRRRFVLGGSVIALAALIVGIIVGRTGDSGPGGADGDAVSSATSVAAVTTSTPIGDDDTLPAAEPPITSSTAASRTGPSTTDAVDIDPSAPVLGRIEIDPAVSSTGIEVVALSNRGELVRIDVETGSTVTTDVDGAQFPQFAPSTVLAGDGWILAPSYEGGGGSTVLFDDGSRSLIDAGSAWPLLATGTGDEFWRAEGPTARGFPDRLVEIAIDGDPTGVEIELDGFLPRMVDPLGGVVVDAPGGSYVLAPGSATRLTVGRVVALGRERMLVHECDEQLDCGHFVVERATGERRALSVDQEAADLSTFDVPAWWALEDPWNGSEDAVLILSWNPTGNGTQSFGVLDLLDGDFRPLGESIDTPTVRWSDDQRLFWLERGRLHWLDRTTGESVLFSEGLGALRAFTIRATSGADSR